MLPLSTRVHSFLDYTVALLLIEAPMLFKFNDDTPAQWVFLTIGCTTILVSLFTRYEGGIIKVIPMPLHLVFDAAAGIFLAESPWLFGFAEIIYLPHLIIGVAEIVVVLLSSARSKS